jgi:hypothetical protein
MIISMLKLEDIYNVTVAKDGQEAYDMVKASMESGREYNLIFMDIQVWQALSVMLLVDSLTLVDAKFGRVTEYAAHPSNGIFCAHCSSDCICGRE